MAVTWKFTVSSDCGNHFILMVNTQIAFTCSKSKIETPEKGVKYVQS